MAYDTRHVDSICVLQHQHQWELEKKKTVDFKAPKVDKNNWAKNIENIVLHPMLVRGERGTLLACQGGTYPT